MTVQALETKWAEKSAVPAARGWSRYGVYVNSNYDSGNCNLINITNPFDHVTHEVEVQIHPDPYCETDKREHMQWFYFRVSNVQGEQLNVRITNAGQASYPSAWKGYNVCASYDRKHWFRIPTTYSAKEGVLSWSCRPRHGAIFFAYFAPYTYEMHQELLAEMQGHDEVRLEMLGETLDGHDLDLLRVGTPAPGKCSIWVLARQHPGESMAEWFAEGLLRRLLDKADPTSRALLASCVFYVVPNMCPDGTWRGHLRTNAAGANLNREWASPCPDRSPEVWLVRRELEEVGCDLLVDVHGDEELHHCFLVDNRGIPRWDKRLEGLHKAFADAFEAASPDFQQVHGYAADTPGAANLSLCSTHVGQHFDCLAVTLEMPFADNDGLPDPAHGWSPDRARRLGAAMLSAVRAVTPALR